MAIAGLRRAALVRLARIAAIFSRPSSAHRQLLLERVDVRTHGVEVRLRPNGARRAGAGCGGQQEGSSVTRATVSADGETITVHIPLTFRNRGGRKLVVTPDGAEWAPRPRVDNAMAKALARAFRWRKMLDTGVHATLEDLAKTERVAPSYISGILRLTLLAPDIVEAVLDGRQPAELQLDDLLVAVPLEWESQKRRLTYLPWVPRAPPGRNQKCDRCVCCCGSFLSVAATQ